MYYDVKELKDQNTTEINFMESEQNIENFMNIDQKKFSLSELQGMLSSTS